MKPSIAILSALSIAAFANAQGSGDECARMNGLALVPYSIALGCLDSFPPLDVSIRNQIIRIAQTLYQLYPYYDIQQKSPEPNFPAEIDIGARLEAISTATLRTDREFHEGISAVFRDLRDAHSVYIHCYKGFLWVQPWSIVPEYPNAARGSTDKSKKPVLKLNSLVTQNWFARNRPLDVRVYIAAFRTSLGYDPALYVGAKILQFDGVDAVDFVLNASKTGETVIGVKDDNARFNSMLSSAIYEYGEFVLGDGELTRTNKIPDSASRRYTLELANGTTTTLDVPWLMINPVSPRSVFTIPGRQEFYELFCMRPELPPGSLVISNTSITINPSLLTPIGRRGLTRRQNIEGIPQPEPLYHDGFDLPSTEKYVPKHEISLQNVGTKLAESEKASKKLDFAVTNDVPILADNYTAFYTLDDQRTGVWVFPTVIPLGIRLSDGRKLAFTVEELESWSETFVTGLYRFQRLGLKKLIIDVSHNGGGIVCFAQLITKLLFSDVKFPVQDMRVSELFTAIANASVTTRFGFYEAVTKPALDGKPRFSRGDWFAPRSPGPANVSGIYTQLYNDSSCNEFISLNIPRLRTFGYQFDYWQPNDVSILSDGGCGSACSFITRAWVAQKKLKVYVYGGPVDVAKGSPFAWCGFDGGPVANEQEIRSEVGALRNQIGLPAAAGEPGTRDSWVNLVALDSLTVVPVSINFSIPVAGTYEPALLDRHIEWTYTPAFDIINSENGFENRPALWAEVAKRMEGDTNNSGNNGSESERGSAPPKSGAKGLVIWMWSLPILTIWFFLTEVL